ncbi:hypothetical protein FSOLCH5_013252 [Fusarium solani]
MQSATKLSQNAAPVGDSGSHAVGTEPASSGSQTMQSDRSSSRAIGDPNTGIHSSPRLIAD